MVKIAIKISNQYQRKLKFKKTKAFHKPQN